MTREANLDARAISEEDTSVFFKRIVAKLHGVNVTKEFLNIKKKQENTVKAITSGEPTPSKGAGKSKGKAPALPKGTKGKGEGKKGERSQTPTPSTTKGGDGKKSSSKGKPALTQGKPVEPQGKSTPSTGAASSNNAPSVTPQPMELPLGSPTTLFRHFPVVYSVHRQFLRVQDHDQDRDHEEKVPPPPRVGKDLSSSSIWVEDSW